MFDTLAVRQQAEIERLRKVQEALPPGMEIIADTLTKQIADKWTITVLEALGEQGTSRFTQIARALPDISQKMLTQTLRRMERDGLVTRTVRPVSPPQVEYSLTALGIDLGIAVCGIWLWAATNVFRVEEARQHYDSRTVE